VIVNELVPGQMFDMPFGDRATFIARSAPHPIYPSLALVIWWLDDGDGWSFDALSPAQDVGEALPSSPSERQARVRTVLLGGGRD
jgi:hypothetical protein